MCVAVNDPFVMNAWNAETKADRVTYLPDGSRTFTGGLGMLVPKDDAGLGQRARRYATVVPSGVIEHMFVAVNRPGDPFVVSDADRMRASLGGKAAPDLRALPGAHTTPQLFIDGHHIGSADERDRLLGRLSP